MLESKIGLIVRASAEVAPQAATAVTARIARDRAHICNGMDHSPNSQELDEQ
jgi:hypothetical protein